ncbi:MAG: Hsp20/alpha crystallin family protein [Clostridia bacterium]|nr:Hsp20/alpha crystallin family protein [Clostridia bacterium]
MKFFFKKKNRPSAPSPSEQVMMDNFFDDFCVAQAKSKVAREKYDASSFTMNVLDQGNRYEITAVLPDVKEKDIDVKYDKGILTVTAYKKGTCVEKGHNFFKQDSVFGYCSKSVKLGSVDDSSMNITFKEGVLNVSINKLTDDEVM